MVETAEFVGVEWTTAKKEMKKVLEFESQLFELYVHNFDNSQNSVKIKNLPNVQNSSENARFWTNLFQAFLTFNNEKLPIILDQNERINVRFNNLTHFLKQIYFSN